MNGVRCGFQGDPDNRRTEKDRERDSGGVREGQRSVGYDMWPYERKRKMKDEAEIKGGEREKEGGREGEREERRGDRMNKNLVGLKDERVAGWKERAFTKKHHQWLR